LDLYVELYRNPQRRRARFHLMFPAGNAEDRQQILVAGCGTSQAAKYALREPDAHITGIDISETSLNCTRELRERHKLVNLELHRLSITDVHALRKTYDQIVCTGVLHHLANPDEGLQSLREVLKPNGAMQILVYARFGRAGITMMQEYARILGIRPSHQELDDLGVTLDCLPKDHPLKSLMSKVKDFTNPDSLADAMLHPRDRAYTVSEIYEWLERCGMSFGRWFEQAPYLPQCGVIARTPHRERLEALPERAQHAAAELFRGTITQHNFVAYRNDRAMVAQPVQFPGAQWRDHVPIRLPWTVCIRDRVPPGTAAVLLNPAHKHSDLILPIDESECELFRQIDGVRTLGEIVKGDLTKTLVPPALSFFQRLWRYDQIVFDASCVRDTISPPVP
jgi:SAM-dependent methyltransferase